MSRAEPRERDREYACVCVFMLCSLRFFLCYTFFFLARAVHTALVFNLILDIKHRARGYVQRHSIGNIIRDDCHFRSEMCKKPKVHVEIERWIEWRSVVIRRGSVEEDIEVQNNVYLEYFENVNSLVRLHARIRSYELSM